MSAAAPRTIRRALAAALVTAAWCAAAGLAAQEPADSAEAGPDSAVVVPTSGDAALQTRLDSARRAERTRRNAVVRSLRPDDRIRVLAEGRTYDGRFLRLAEGHLFLRTGEGPRPPGAPEEGAANERARPPARPAPPGKGDSVAVAGVQQIPVDAMETLWIRLGRTGTGALWGGVLGTVGGAVGGYLINESICGDAEDCIFDAADAAVVYGIGGGLAGVGFGALIGRSFKEWRQWFPRPADADDGGS